MSSKWDSRRPAAEGEDTRGKFPEARSRSWMHGSPVQKGGDPRLSKRAPDCPHALSGG